MPEFEIGDYVEIMCHDGKTFKGVLMEFTDLYFILTPGLGFPFDEVLTMVAA